MGRGEGIDVSDPRDRQRDLRQDRHRLGLAVEIVAELPGVEPDVAAKLVEQAHQFCPYSKATRDNIVATARVA